MEGQEKIFNPFDNYDNGILIRRWLATFLDYFTIFIFTIPLHFISESLHKKFPSGIVFLFFLGYFIFFEGYFGATPGKFFTGIRVVDLTASPPGFKKATIRTLTRILEVNPILLGGLPAGLIALSNQSKQRMGDIIAHTHVWRLADVNKMRELMYQLPDTNVPGAESETKEPTF